MLHRPLALAVRCRKFELSRAKPCSMLHRPLALAVLLLVAAPASSQEIRFETEELADSLPDEDRRLYRYAMR